MNNKHSLIHLAFIRMRLGFTQQELAVSLGISRSLLGMAETGKRSLPAHTMPLLTDLEKLSRQVLPADQDNKNEENGLSSSLIYNRVSKKYRQRNTAGHSLLKAVAAGLVQGGVSITAGITAVIQESPLPVTIPGINTFDELLWSQAVQKTALAQQLQHRLRERKAAGLKRQELKVVLTYTNSMIAIQHKRMYSLRIPLLKKNAAARKAKLQYKKMLLEKQLLRFNAPALLQRELQINILQRHLNELDNLLQVFGPRLNDAAVVGEPLSSSLRPYF